MKARDKNQNGDKSNSEGENVRRGWGQQAERNDRSHTGTDNEGEISNEPTFVGTPGEIGSASLGGSFDDERGGGTSGRGGNDGGTMSVRNDNAPHFNDHGTNPRQQRGNQQNNAPQGSNPGGNNERG